MSHSGRPTFGAQVSAWPLLAALLQLSIGLEAQGPGAQPSVVRRSDGPGANDLFGWSVDVLGDLDGDAIPEIVAGAPQFADQSGVIRGRALVLSGASGTTLWTFDGATVDALFGQSVANAGDVDGDGLDDIVIGAPGTLVNGQPNGSVVIRSGADGTLIRQIDGAVPGGRFGESVAAVRDFTGNGIPDLVIGASDDDTAGALAGAVFLYGDNPMAPPTVVRGAVGDRLGRSVAGIGDINGDDRDDLIVGAPRLSQNNSTRPYVLVLSGADASTIYRRSFQARSGFGFSVDGGGDFDLDGVPDFAVGAPFYDQFQADVGIANVYSGATGANLGGVQGVTAAEGVGESVCLRGDVTGDGLTDLVTGGLGFDRSAPFIPDAGAVRVLDAASGFELFLVPGDARSDGFGCAVAAADFDADGFDDIVVGARTADFNGFSSGSTYLISAGLTGTPARTVRIGRSCEDASGVRPLIQHTGKLLAGSGLAFILRSGVPDASSVLLAGLPLPAPLPLVSLGGLDCDLLVDAAAIAVPAVASPNGEAFVSIRMVPVTPASIGTSLVAQWAQPIPNGLTLPVILSDGLQMTFGDL